MTTARNPAASKPFESSTLSTVKALFCTRHNIDPKKAKTDVLNQLLQISMQVGNTEENLLPSQIRNRLLDHSNVTITNLPNSGDAKAAKQQLSEQHKGHAEKNAAQEKKREDLKTKSTQFRSEFDKHIENLKSIGALESETVAHSQPVVNTINSEKKAAKTLDSEIKRFADQQADLTESIVEFTHTVLRRQPDAPTITSIVPDDEQHLLRGTRRMGA